MGNKQTKSTTSHAKTAPITPPTSKVMTSTTTTTTADGVAEYNLKKHRPGCTGMFWRPDPTGSDLSGSSSAAARRIEQRALYDLSLTALLPGWQPGDLRIERRLSPANRDHGDLFRVP